nr:phosphatidylserine decarboxylase proenzyme 1, mitochondrial [Quercus suber]
METRHVQQFLLRSFSRPCLLHRPTKRLRFRTFHHYLHARKEPTSSQSHQSSSDGKSSSSSYWQPIPIALGVAFLGAFQFYRINVRERRRREEELWRSQDPDAEDEGPLHPKKRPRIRPSGPWSVQIMSTIPLKALSRWWGWFNSIEIPYYLRVPGFKLYGWVFGVNFEEVSEDDLHTYKNLSQFFYRTLKPGVRPIDPNPNALVSPADGKVVQFGYIESGEVEQVKGVTYSVDALLGMQKGSKNTRPETSRQGMPGSPQPSAERQKLEDNSESIRADEEFAQVNGISYTLPNLFSGGSPGDRSQKGSQAHRDADQPSDQSTTSRASSEAEVAKDLAASPRGISRWLWSRSKSPASPSSPPTEAEKATGPTALYYCVIYLAPGDYHRFHSPCSWVVDSRRHFAGELFSVSPYLVRSLPGLFTLNERVVLLGRWRHGFFSYTPVGATNVGSIIVNFDRELRTNSLLTDTLADRAAEKAAQRGEPYSGYAEATYASASPVLGGHALQKGEEMGGFQLGSTIVMVFEAPKGRRPSLDEGWGMTGAGSEEEGGNGRVGGWRWNIEKGQKVKVGERLGVVVGDEEHHAASAKG